MTRERRGAGAQWRRVLSGAGLLALVGCSAPLRRSDTATDSAGVSIIESSAPKFGPGQGLRVAETPTLDLVGPPGGTFGEAMSAVRLSDGRVVVADGRPPVIRYFGADGRWLYDVGSVTDGRGALQSIFDLSIGRADTVTVYDIVARRVVLVDPNGAIGGTITVAEGLVPPGSNGFLPHGPTPDGRYLLQRDEIAFPFAGKVGEVLPDSTAYFWMTRDGTLADSSDRLLAGEIFGFAVNTGRPEPLIAPLARPLGGRAQVAMGPSLVWYGESRRWELRGLDAHGRVAQIIRLARPASPLTPERRDSFVARFRAIRAGREAGMVQRQFAEGIGNAPFPDTLPAFTALFAGRDSTLWAQHSGLIEGHTGDEALDWTVIGADGRWSQEITMPAGFRPTAAGKDWVLGLWRDPRGPVHVRLYPLVAGGT